MAIAVAVFSVRSTRSTIPTVWPSYPITPRTLRPALRASSASRPASAGEQPARGSPTFMSTKHSRKPAAAAAKIVAGESTAMVTRASSAAKASSRNGSITSLAKSKSAPSPARAMPIISLGVAQVKASWPTASWRWARAVHLCALTWGRAVRPGRAEASAAKLWSRRAESTTSAGVGSSLTRE
ncbi:unannotated protein [freshwater metagenome]|uniref:Unannotated protein n=1 Tax=freshwater metagenome TaxID=449393 RepID=A0A6J7RUL8_9ZZZZ